MWQPRRLRTLFLLYDVTAWSGGFALAAGIRYEFDLTLSQLGRALCAALVSAALYAAVARLRPVPLGRLPIGTRHELEALTATVVLTTTVLLAALSLLGNRPVPPSVPMIGSGITLLLILAVRFGYRLWHEPEANLPHGRPGSSPSPARTPELPLSDRAAAAPAAPRGLVDAPVLAAHAEDARLVRTTEVLRTVAGSPRLSATVRPTPTAAVARRVRDRMATPAAALPRRRALPVRDPQRVTPPEQPPRSRRDRATAAGATGSPRRSRTGRPGRKETSDQRLPGQGRRPDLVATSDGQPTTELAPYAPDLTTYRTAVAELLARVAPHPFAERREKVETILTERLAEPALAAVLAATPAGITGTTTELLHELRSQHRQCRDAAVDTIALIRIYLLSRIDAMWWGHAPAYLTDSDVLTSADLVDLDPLRRRKLLRFRYRRQAQTLLSRVTRAAERRVWTRRAPRTPGLLFTRARAESVALLNRLSRDFARLAPPATPPLWATSLTRSIEHQHRLRALGYAAMLPSSHCVGYGMDIEMSWFRRFDAHRALEMVLLEHQGRGAINVIDEGQVWHVCISPAAIAELRSEFQAELGGEA